MPRYFRYASARSWRTFNITVILLATASLFFAYHTVVKPALTAFDQELQRSAHSLEDSSHPLITYNTSIHADDGTVLGYLSGPRRLRSSIKDLPWHVSAAILAIEDERFYLHRGISLLAILRALITNVQAQKLIQGGSTITQQTARALFLSPEKSLTRKLKELPLALMLERRLSKEQILDLYTNHIYFGRGAYGIKAAAERYFGKQPRDLQLQQSAYLAGLLKAPSMFARHPHKALARKNQVLKKMHQLKWMSHYDYTLARKQDPALISYVPPRTKEAPYFLDAAQRELSFYLDHKTAISGLQVQTSYNRTWQHTLDQHIQKHWALLHQLSAHKRRFIQEVQVAGVVLHSRTSQIVAIRGGKSYQNSQYNRALFTRRAMGHLIIPFLATVLVQRGISLHTPLMPQFSRSSIRHSIRNQDLYALAASVRDYGYGSVQNLLTNLGHPTNRQDLSLLLGQEPLSPLHVAKLYAALLQGSPSPHRPSFVHSILWPSSHKTLTLNPTAPLPTSSPSSPPSPPSPSERPSLFSLIKYGFHSADCSIALHSVDFEHDNYWSVVMVGAMVMVIWIGSERGRILLPKLPPQHKKSYLHISHQIPRDLCSPAHSRPHLHLTTQASNTPSNTPSTHSENIAAR